MKNTHRAFNAQITIHLSWLNKISVTPMQRLNISQGVYRYTPLSHGCIEAHRGVEKTSPETVRNIYSVIQAQRKQTVHLLARDHEVQRYAVVCRRDWSSLEPPRPDKEMVFGATC